MDYDNDGILDFISGSYDPGDLYLFRGLGKGQYAKRERIDDENGIPLVHHPKKMAQFMELQKQTQDSETLNSDDAISLRVASFGSWPAIVDWDDDGDNDILIGSFSGNIFLRENIGTRSAPKYDGTCIQLSAAGSPIKETCHACPVVADWDGDGTWDLVVGSGDGSVSWYQNTGSLKKPEFGPRQQLVSAKSENKFKQYTLAEGELTPPSVRAQICVVDYNLDGKLDLVVGDYCDVEVTRKLTETEQAELKQLEAEIKKASQIFSAAQQAWLDSKEAGDEEIEKEKMEVYSKRKTEMIELVNKREDYFLSTHRSSAVWVYLRKNEKASANTARPKRRTSSPPDKNEKETKKSPVQFNVELKDGENENQKIVALNYSIKEGWFLHLNDPATDDRAITLELSVPDSLTVGTWKKPIAIPALDNPSKRILVGSDSFEITVTGTKDFNGSFELEIAYQVCNKDYCLPKNVIKKKIEFK